MRKKLVCYMLALALLLFFALFCGILVLGRFESPKKETSKSLDLQMEVFKKDTETFFETLAANCIDLSSFVSDYINNDSQIAGDSFNCLNDNPSKIEEIQTFLVENLSQKLKQQNCSGVFVVLDATVNSSIENSNFSRTGIYLQHNRYFNDQNIVLYRGISSVGKMQNVMPHRKWRLEFNVNVFPNYDQIKNDCSKLPLEKSFMLTENFTLTGTTDEVVLLALPIIGGNGQCYGVCGFEISADYFSNYHEQPTKYERLTCLLMTKNDQGYLSTGLNCCGIKNHIQHFSNVINVKDLHGLTAFSDEKLSYVGVYESVKFTPNNSDYYLAVMIPQEDYKRSTLNGWLQISLLILLLLFFAISCCLFFSKRFLSPILKGLELIKQKKWREDSSIPEINDLFEYLAKYDEENGQAINSAQNELSMATQTYQDAQKKYDEAQNELQQAKKELARLAYSRKTEVDPDNYKMFLEGLKTLTTMEKQILDYYLEGKSVKEIIELTGVKESTIRFHNRNIYSKLYVNSLKQLLLYAAMNKQTKNE